MPSFRQKSTSSEFYKNFTGGPIFARGSWEYLVRTKGTHHAPTLGVGAGSPLAAPRQDVGVGERATQNKKFLAHHQDICEAGGNGSYPRRSS